MTGTAATGAATTEPTAPRLSRSTSPDAAPIPPIRIVHLGLGAFHRAHQAWYTAHASDAADWGIAAFTGRSPEQAQALAAQDGLFTLVERGPRDDRVEIVRSIVDAFPGTDVASFVDLLARPAVAIVTLTLTEAGYRLGPEGLPDLTDSAVTADLAILRAAAADPAAGAKSEPTTALGRLLLGLDARRRAGAPGIAIVCCDNLPDNGALVQRAVLWLADEVDPALAAWIRSDVSFVATSVDRITPHPTDADRADAQRLTGLRDEAAVVTEPFTDWVLSGDFPSGRPRWETAGARFVDDVHPWENRKLWMLNGAHTALAAIGAVRGHELVSEAISDEVCRDLVERLWDEDARHLPDPALDLAGYRAALVERFSNPRIAHRLDQIAQDAVTKLRVRIVPVAVAELAAGRSAAACAGVVAAWILAADPGPGDADTHQRVATLDQRLGDHPAFCAEVDTALASLATDTPRR